MDNTPRTSPEAWRLQILKLLQANPTLSQRQLAERMGVSLGKANYCLRALVQKGLVKLGNFSRNPNKRQYAYILTPAGLEEKTHITLTFLKRKEAEFEALRHEIEMLRSELEPPFRNDRTVQLQTRAAFNQISNLETGALGSGNSTAQPEHSPIPCRIRRARRNVP